MQKWMCIYLIKYILLIIVSATYNNLLKKIEIVANEWIHATTHNMRVGMEDHCNVHTLLKRGKSKVE
jgi:hypothetical protein